MKEIDLENCRVCKESRCIMSKYYGIENIEAYDEKLRIKKILKDEYNRKSKEYYIKETKYYEKVLDREDKLTNYDRMNESDRMHQRVWDLTIIQLMELQEKYYSNIKY